MHQFWFYGKSAIKRTRLSDIQKTLNHCFSWIVVRKSYISSCFGAWPSGKALDFDSMTTGSNPVAPAIFFLAKFFRFPFYQTYWLRSVVSVKHLILKKIIMFQPLYSAISKLYFLIDNAKIVFSSTSKYVKSLSGTIIITWHIMSYKLLITQRWGEMYDWV